MNAAGRVPHVVRQVDLGSLPEITLRQRSFAKARRHERMNCRAQRASMPTARLVIFKIDPADLRGHALPEQMDQHYHIWLLDDLGSLNALATEQHVHRCIARRERRQGRFPPTRNSLGTARTGRSARQTQCRDRARHAATGAAPPAQDRAGAKAHATVGQRSATSRATSAATCRFHCASPLVYALSSTVSWYSSGPITPRIW